MIKKKCNIRVYVMMLGLFACLCGCGNQACNYEFEVIDEVSQEFVQQSTDEDIDYEQTVFVHVCGAVVNPGVYELPDQSRLFEAITLAGGFLPEADQNCLNLAQLLLDGQQIYVYTIEERQSLEMVADSGSVLNANALVNINTATVQQLKSIPGIGDSKAQAIVAYREKKGYFDSIEQIKKVEGIKEGLFEKIKDYITVY